MGPKKLYCTRCDSLLVARSESTPQPDRHSASSVIYTFECQACGLRFQVSQQDIIPAAEPQDRRKAPRVPISMRIDLECGEHVGEGMITDISKGGCAVESPQPLTIGQLLRLKFPPPTGSVENLGTQKIAAVQNLRGQKAGVKFLAFTDEEKSKLTKTVTKSIQYFPPAKAK